MSTNVGAIHYDLDLNTKKFDSAVSGIGNKIQSIGSKMSSIGKTMTMGLTLPIIAGAGFAVKAASDLNETMNKVDVAFKGQAKTVKQWAKTSIESMGLAQGSALDAAALFGDMSTAMGLNEKQAAKMSTSLVQLGADLASFKNISFERAQIALAGIYTGETEALKSLGIVMTETNLEEFARAQGISKSIKEMTQAEKVQLRYAYVMSVTKNAQGDFNRTSQGTANQIRQTQERFKELSAEIGQKLLPYVNNLLKFIQGLIDKFNALKPAQQNMILIFIGIVAVLGPLLVILGSLISSVGIIIALFSNPVFWIIAGILAVIAGVAYLVWKNWDKIKPAVDGVVASLKVAYAWFAQNILPILKSLWAFMVTQFKAAWRDIKIAIGEVTKALAPFKGEFAAVAKFILGSVVVAIVAFIIILGTTIAWIARVIGWLARLSAWYNNLLVSVRRFVQGGLGAMGSFVSGVANTVGRVGAIFGSVTARMIGVVSSLPGIFFRTGANIIQAFVSGIMSMASAPANAVSQVLASVRSLLPSSPAKEGPFSGKGWTLYSGMSMMEALADGIKRSSDIAYRTMNNMLSNLSSVAAQPVTSSQPTQSPSIKTSTNIYGNVNIGDKPTADYFFARANRKQDLLNMGLAPIGDV